MGASQNDRLKWTEDLDFDVPVIDETNHEEYDYLYWIGCAGAFDDRNVPVTKAVATLLKEQEFLLLFLDQKKFVQETLREERVMNLFFNN